MAETKYAAFISYSHKDEAVARWLHRRLETYAIPRGAAPGYGRKGLLGRRIGRVFRDREELPAGYPLTSKINEALAASDALIVLCSPNASGSEFVNKEIIEFQRLGKGDRIFPVIVDGEDHDIFPPALSDKREVLEADMRPGKDGRDHAALKLLAGLMGAEPNDLTQREARAQRLRLALSGGGMAVFAALAVAAGFGFHQANENAQRARDTLYRFLVANGERALDDNRPFLAIRYALVGQQLSPTNAPEYEVLLANAYERIGHHRVFDGHEGAATAVAFSPDGRRIASASPDGTLRFWDVITGKQIGMPLVYESKGWIIALAFSPDGRRIISGGTNGTLRLWDATTGRQIGAPWTGHLHSVNVVAFSPDGLYMVSGSYDGTLGFWDAATRRPIGTPRPGHEAWVSDIAFSPDGRRVVSGGYDGTLRFWDAATGRPIGRPLLGHDDPVLAVAFSPDGRRMVSGSSDGTLRLWDAATGRQIGALSTAHAWASPENELSDSSELQLTFSPDGRHIVSGGLDGTLRLWDAANGRQIGTPRPGHEDGVTALAFSPDGRRIISGGEDSTLRLWDVATGHQIGAPLRGHEWAHRESWAPEESGVFDVAVSPDGRHIVSGGVDGTLRLWDATTGRQIGTPRPAHKDGVTAVAFSPDGRRIVSGGADRTLRLWDAATGRQIGAPFTGHELVDFGDGINSVAFSPDGRRIVSAGSDKTLRLWDAAIGRQIGRPFTGNLYWVNDVAFSPDGRRIVSAGSDKTLRLWDAATGRQIGRPFTGNLYWVNDVAFSPDGRRIVSAGSDKTLRLWDAATGRQIGAPLTGHEGTVNALAFSPDGRHIVSGGDDQTLRLWDVATGRQIGAPLTGHEGLGGGVNAVAFFPDGRRIVSGGSDRTLRLWDVSRLVALRNVMAREACLTMLGHSGRTFSREEIDVDPLLFAEWNDPTRDVCAGVPGLPPLRKEFRRQ